MLLFFKLCISSNDFRYVTSELEDEIQKIRKEKYKIHQRSIRFFLQNKNLQKNLYSLISAREEDLKQLQKIQNQIKSVVTTRQADLQKCQKNIEVIVIEDVDEEDGSMQTVRTPKHLGYGKTSRLVTMSEKKH